METAEAEEGGPQQIETLPNASNMAPSNAAAESGAPGARDEEEDDDADGAADGTQRNDAKGGEQIRELRRFFAGKILGALPCVQDAPGLWIFPARMYIEHGPDASDTTASHTCRRSLQTHRRTRPGCYHSQESARISVIAMVITATRGAHRSRRKTGTLHAPHDHCLRLSRCTCDHQAHIVGYSLSTHL